jgi:hypothetical protein
MDKMMNTANATSKSFSFYKKDYPISEFFAMHVDIDMNPIHQRLQRNEKDKNLFSKTGSKETVSKETVSKTLTKQQAIIESLRSGIDIGQITIHETTNGTYRYESIDGGHRKRAIIAFMRGEFADASGKRFSEYSIEDQKAFKSIVLSFCIYYDITPQKVGTIFRTLNSTTQVNDQENLNSYGNTAIANMIRQFVRGSNILGKGVGDKRFKQHPLFSGAKDEYFLLAFNNEGLKVEEMVARLVYRYWFVQTERKRGGAFSTEFLGKSNQNDLIRMYDDETLTDRDINAIYTRAVKCLNFIERWTNFRRMTVSTKLPQKEFVLFQRIWMYLETISGGHFDIRNEHEVEEYDLFTHVYGAYSEFKKNYDDKYLPTRLTEISPLDAGKTVHKQFNDALGYFKDDATVRFSINELIDALALKSIHIESFIIVKDKIRFFSLAERQYQLDKQDKKCYVTGKPITIDNAHGAHKIAHSKGGRTTRDNLVMVSAHINTDMGSLSVDDYMKINGYSKWYVEE